MSNIKLQPNVTQYNEVDITRKDISFLVATADGEKYLMKGIKINSFIEIKEDTRIKESNSIKDLIEDNTINLGTVINILANKNIEKVIDKIGSIYFDGDNIRVRTKDGWKTLIYKDERP